MRLRPRGLNNGQLRVVERTSEGGEVGGGCQGPQEKEGTLARGREGAPVVRPLDRHYPRDKSWSETITVAATITESRHQIESRCQIALW